MEEYIHVVQGLLAGQTLEWNFEEKRRKICFMDPEIGAVNIKDPIPLQISAFGPKGRALIARLKAGFIDAPGGARRMAGSAAHLVDEVIPRVPVRQWVLSHPIPLRILFAAHPELLAPVLRTIHRVIAGFLPKQAGLKRATTNAGAVTLIQRFGSAANLNIHLHCLVQGGVYRCTEGQPVFQEVRAPSRDE